MVGKYRVVTIIVKYFPILIALLYLLESILSCFGVECLLLVMLGNMTLLPIILILSMSFLLQFCTWHRLPIYYVMVVNTINIIDYYFKIPLNSAIMLAIYLSLALFATIIGIYLHNKNLSHRR